MTAAVEDCDNKMIGQCNTEEEVTEMKDYQFQGILNQLATGDHEWDSEKCPAVKYVYIFEYLILIINFYQVSYRAFA